MKTLELLRPHKKIIFAIIAAFVLFKLFAGADDAAKEITLSEDSASQEITALPEEIVDEDAQEVTDEEGEGNDAAEVRNLAQGDFRLVINTDDLQISQDIVRGVTEEDLKKGIGRHITTGYPNEDSGNVVLSGHRWYPGKNPNYRIFEDLDKLKHGDHVSVFYEGKEFIYEVFADKVVGAKDVEILDPTPEPQLTLYTCTPKYTSLKRLVYVAKLVDVKSDTVALAQ